MDRRVPIAIVGFGCRFPKARDPQAFWRLLRDGSDAITEVPADRGWDLAALYDPDRISSGTMNTRWGGFVDGVAEFDPDFFGVSVGEACGMDPQQRLVLEVAWEALEHANIAADRLSASDTSVFIGACNVDYPTAAFGDLARINAYYTAGTASCMIANRVSHFLDLRGPSIGVDTGCSSSLVAAHLACQSLARGETSLALVGGVNLVLSPRTTVGLSQSWMMAPDGRCKSFDARANGYVRGEGCGLVVLKRLDDALRDGDEIHGVLLGSAVNQDGRGIGLTSPNRSALEAVMVQALQQAGVEAEDVDLIEAHGIGSALTDAIEGQALSAVYGKASREGGACLVGSVKTNIGHLESAAGAAGLIKVLLALRNREIPRHLHFQALNPRLAESPFPLAIPVEATPWGKAKDTGRSRLAGINSFGLGGTNAHLLVGEWSRPVDASVADEAESRLYILPISAKSTQALRALASRYAAHLSAHPEDSLAAVCRTAAVGRSHFAHRLAVSARSRAELIAQLEAFAEGRELSTPSSDTPDDARRLASAAAYVRGDDVDGKAQQLVDGVVGPRVSLPTYPFQRRQCWPGSERRKAPKAARSSVRPEPIAQPARSPSAPIELAAELDANARPLLADHWIHGSIVVSGPTQVAMLLDASAPSKAAGPLLLEDLAFLQPLILDEGTSRATRIVLTPLSDGGHRFRIDTRAAGPGHAEDPWVTHSSGTIDRRAPVPSPAPLDPAQLERRRDEALSGEALYQSMSRRGIELGPGFRWLDRLWTAEGEALCQMRAASASDGVENGSLHPGRFDSCFQLLFACPGAPPEGEAYMLLGVDRIRLVQSDGHRFCHARLRPGDRGETFSGDVTIFDEAGNPAVTLEGIHFKRAPRAALQNSAASASVLAPSVHTAGAPREDAELIRRLAAEPAHEHGAIVLSFVREEAASVLQQDPASLDPDRGLFDLGMSSLMSLELSNRLRIAVGRSVPLPTTLVFDRPTIAGLSEYLLARLKGTSEVAPRAAVVPATSVAAVPAQSANEHEPIAIIGLGCRFPGGAEDPETFWAILRDGVDAITEVPPERWSLDAWFDPNPDAPGKMYTKYGGFVKGVDRFDAAFFGIAPREAISLDPQHRLLLEVSWEALEHAGIAPDGLVGTRTGTFVGTCFDDYAKFSMNAGDPAAITAYAGTGVESCFTAGRLSYVLGLSGPAMHVDTACSTSLVAIHLACQSLRTGECNLALAGASNLMLSPDNTVYFSKLRAMAADGRCRSFDAGASGYVRGEGCGVVVLKRLSDAIRDGDRVLGLIRGSAVNHDGKSSGLTVPNGAAQEAVIRDALSRAQIAPSQVGYVEAHGSGTPIGDPIEMRALGAVLGEGRAPEDRFLVGSVKTNIGHLEPAAGVAGIIKLVLAFQHEEIPAHLHFQKINPLIELEDAKAAIATARTPWPAGSRRRVAGISAFGLSGTNAHIVVEEAPATGQQKAPPREVSSHLLPLSAKGPEALKALAQSYHALLKSNRAEVSLDDITYTASVRRSHHTHRLAVVASTREEMAAALEAFANGDVPASVVSGTAAGGGRLKIVFVFPGQGSQWVGMGRSLLDEEPAFREAIEACDAVIRRESGFSVLEELCADEARSRLGAIDVLQPTLFAVEVALAALWRAWGVEPNAVVGHSMGEAAAAYVAGALRLEDAAAIICRRSRLLRRMSGKGAMALVELTLQEAEQALEGLEDRLSVAVSNGPRSTVIAGDPAALEEVLARLEAAEVFCRRVKVDVASHSPQMDPLLEELTTTLSGLQPKEGAIPMRSTVTGEEIAGGALDAKYWARNLRAPVLFARAIRALAESGTTIFVEMSPHPILVPAITEGLRHDEREGAALPSLRRDHDGRRALLASLGALYTCGYRVPFERQYPSGGHVVSLPSYPWQRERYWLEPPKQSSRRLGHAAGHPLVGEPIELSIQPGTFLFRLETHAADVAYLKDHQVDGSVVLPAAAYVEAALSAAAAVHGARPMQIKDLSLKAAMVLPDDGPIEVQLALSPTDTEETSFRFQSRRPPSLAWTTNASGTLAPSEVAAPQVSTRPGEIVARCPDEISGDRHDEAMRARGIVYGPAFRGLERMWRRAIDQGGKGEVEAIGRLSLPGSELSRQGAYRIHPALLDAALQVLGSLSSDGEMYLPVGIARLALLRPPPSSAFCHAQLRTSDADLVEGELRILDEEGAVILQAEGVRLRRIPRAAAHPLSDVMFALEWRSRAEQEPSKPEAPGRWLILDRPEGGGGALAASLEARGDQAILVRPGDAYARVDAAHYVVSPSQPTSYERLIRDALEDGVPCRGVVHLFGRGELAEGQSRSALESALHLVQALATAKLREEPRLWLVTSGVQMPTAATTVDGSGVAQGALWGFARAVAHEHPELRCSLVDVAAGPAIDGDALARELLADAPEDQVVLRPGARHVARLVRSEPLPLAEPLRLRDDATYLISGGLGGLGLTIARWMVDRGARHIVLMGRRPPSEVATRAIDEMRAAGAEVRPVRADVSLPEDVARTLSEIDRNMPALAGVLHAAAVLDDGTLLKLDSETFDAVMAPKARGAWNLHVQTLERPLDFFVLFSSGAGVLGSMGQASYGGANAVLDALAHHRRAARLPALSIDWGAWTGVGWVAADAERGDRLAAQGIRGISVEQGLLALEELIQRGATQSVVTSIDWRQWREAHLTAANAPLLAEIEAEPGSSVRKRSGELRAALEAAEPASRRTMLEAHLREQIGQVLRMPPARIEASTPFGSLGLDSLMGLEIRNRLEASLGLKLSATLLWTVPTVTALLPYLAEKMGLALGDATPKPAPAAQPEGLSIDKGDKLRTALASLKKVSPEDLRRALAEAATTKRRRA